MPHTRVKIKYVKTNIHRIHTSCGGGGGDGGGGGGGDDGSGSGGGDGSTSPSQGAADEDLANKPHIFPSQPYILCSAYVYILDLLRHPPDQILYADHSLAYLSDSF